MQPITVLVAEPELGIRDLLRDYLAELDIAVIGAANPADALSLLQQRHVDLVLADLDLPHPGAAGFFEAVVRLRPELRQRFIFTGVFAESFDRDDNGCVRLAKPFNFDALAKAIRMLYSSTVLPGATGSLQTAAGSGIC